MGLSRGKAHISGFLGVENTEVAYVCDVDQTRLAGGIKHAAGRQSGKEPKGVTDFRIILDEETPYPFHFLKPLLGVLLHGGTRPCV